MKIKEIKLYGFKSFREETQVLLNTGVTAFVGPNGSGKSNIFDALRWVFGEQSMKALRCEKIEDLIYMSSDQKEDANFTEVAVTINNEDYFTQFGSEFEIKRRFYRTGESEFFLNRVKCRLQDIQALFLNSGALTYSFLELAEVERIIHGDTKDMFDDVAGILKYQERKEQTNRRLVATEQDLLRLEDIIGEMQRGLRSLRRQVRQARLFNELRTEYKHLMLFIMANDFKICVQEIAGIQAQIDGKDALRQSVLQTSKQLEDEREELKQSIEKAEGERRSKLAQITQVDEAIESLQNKVAEMEEEVRSKTLLSERLLTSIREKQETVNGDKKHIAELENESREILAKLEQLQKEVASVVAERDAKNEECFAVEKSLKEHGEDTARVAREIMTLNNEMARLKYDLENKEDMLSRMNDELGTINNEIEKNDRAKRELERELDDIVREQSATDAKLQNSYEKASALEKNVVEIETDLTRRNEAMADCRILVDTLSHRLQAEGRQEIEARFGKKTVGMVRDSIEVASGYESIVDICLSDLLDYYLLKDYTVEDFAHCPEGRFGFIDMARSKESQGRVSPTGVVSISQFMKFRSAQDVLAFYVRDYFLVDNYDQAGRLSNEYPQCGFVTSEGLLFRNGVIVIQKGDVGFFKIKQSIEDSKKKLESLQNEALFIAEEKKRLQEEIEQLKGDIENFRNKIFAVNVNKSECSLKLQDVVKLVEKRTEELNGAKEDRATLVEDRDAIAEKIKIIEQNIQQVESGKAQKDHESQTLSENMHQLRIEIDNMNTRLNGFVTDRAVLEERNAIIRQSIGQLEKGIQTVESEIAALREESRPDRITQLADSINALKEELLHKRQEKSACEATLPAQQMEDYRMRQSLVYDKLAQQQKDHESLQDQIMQLKYQLFEKNHRRDDMTRKADEEFHVQLSDYVPEEEIAEAQNKLAEVKGRIEKLGEVNPLSLQAYEEEKKRLDEFLKQRDDIITAKQNLLKSIEELDQRARERFNEIFEEVRQQFNYVFTNFLEDGQADLMLTDPENPLASKVEIVVRMMGRRLKTINQLSGGQKTLLAISLLLAFYLVKPAPFCILDEIDAPLDDINVVRFNRFLRELSQRTQVVIITHNRATMEYADYLYGLTMERPRESKVISAKLADLEKISTIEDGN